MKRWEFSVKGSTQNTVHTMVSNDYPHRPPNTAFWAARVTVPGKETAISSPQDSGGQPEVMWWGRIWPLEGRMPSPHPTVCLRICFPLILTGYKSLGGGDRHIQLCICPQTRNITDRVCAVLLRTKMTRMPGQPGDRGEQNPQPTKGYFLIHTTHKNEFKRAQIPTRKS